MTPRKVFHLIAPVETLIAYSKPSQEPTYATPETIVGWEAMGPPVAIDQRFVSNAAWVVSIPVSLLTPSREMSWSDVGQLSLACVAAAAWPSTMSRNAATKVIKPIVTAPGGHPRGRVPNMLSGDLLARRGRRADSRIVDPNSWNWRYRFHLNVSTSPTAAPERAISPFGRSALAARLGKVSYSL